MEFRVPDGEEDAKVAFTTRRTATTVMYHLRWADQFLGFSMSVGEKSSWPCALREGVDSRAFERYGLAGGRESRRSSFSISARVSSSDDEEPGDAVKKGRGKEDN